MERGVAGDGTIAIVASATAFLRAGSVIATTPAMTATSPMPAVLVTVSPRKTTPMAMPIGTLR